MQVQLLDILKLSELNKSFFYFFLDQLHQEIEKFVFKNFPSKVQLVKTPKREGLIRARIFGAKKATGQVIFNLIHSFSSIY